MVINDFLHYSEVPFGSCGERTIFGKENDQLQYEYSDRLIGWDSEKHKYAVKNNTEKKHTSKWYQKYLELYYGCKIDLQHIKIGVNISNGYQYQVYGFKKLS